MKAITFCPDSLFDPNILKLDHTDELVFRKMLHFTSENGVFYGDPNIVAAMIRMPIEVVGKALNSIVECGLGKFFFSGPVRFIKLTCFSADGVIGVATSGFPDMQEEHQMKVKLVEVKDWAPDNHQSVINNIFGRRKSTRWNNKELVAYKSVEITDADLELVASYYRAAANDKEAYLRTTILTLLNNWAGEVDRARHYFEVRSTATVEGGMRPETVETKSLL